MLAQLYDNSGCTADPSGGRHTGQMSEQPNRSAVGTGADEPGQQAAAEREAAGREHVRTEGETNVDDALGSADEPG
jgi:hypothetical protein